MALTTTETTLLKKVAAKQKLLNEIKAINDTALAQIKTKRSEIDTIDSKRNTDLQVKRDAVSALGLGE